MVRSDTGNRNFILDWHYRQNRLVYGSANGSVWNINSEESAWICGLFCLCHISGGQTRKRMRLDLHKNKCSVFNYNNLRRQILEIIIISWKNNKLLNYISLAIIIIMIIVFAYFTFNPLYNEFFFDPMAEKYGINTYKIK